VHRFRKGYELKGLPSVKKLPGRGGWELRLVVQGGMRILDKIEALNLDGLPSQAWHRGV